MFTNIIREQHLVNDLKMNTKDIFSQFSSIYFTVRAKIDMKIVPHYKNKVEGVSL